MPGCSDQNVARSDDQRHLAAVPRHHADVGVEQVVELAQIALRLADQAPRVPIALLEQQLRAQSRFARLDVQVVGQPVERFVLARIVLVEDVLILEADLADDRATRLELLRARHRGLRFGGAHRLGLRHGIFAAGLRGQRQRKNYKCRRQQSRALARARGTADAVAGRVGFPCVEHESFRTARGA